MRTRGFAPGAGRPGAAGESRGLRRGRSFARGAQFVFRTLGGLVRGQRQLGIGAGLLLTQTASAVASPAKSSSETNATALSTNQVMESFSKPAADELKKKLHRDM